MFSYVDLVRVEIAMDVEQRFGNPIPDEEAFRWQTLGDVVRSVVGHSRKMANEGEVFSWVCRLMTETYGVSMDLTPEGDVFGDYDQVTGWFLQRSGSAPT